MRGRRFCLARVACQTDGVPSWTRVFAGAAVLVAAWLLASAAAVGIHAWNMHGAALRCEDGYHVERGGWAEPDFCRPPSGGDGPVAERVASNVLDPWPSAVIAATVVLGGAAGGVVVLTRLARLRALVSVVLFASCAVILAGGGALLLLAS